MVKPRTQPLVSRHRAPSAERNGDHMIGAEPRPHQTVVHIVSCSETQPPRCKAGTAHYAYQVHPARK